MSLARYLASLAPQLALLAAAYVLALFMLVVAGMGIEFTLLVGAVLVAGAAVAVLLGYLRRRHFYQSLATFSTSTDYARWLAEMVERPDFLEGEITYDALRQIAKAANDDVATARRLTKEYREYIETWVHEAKSPLAAAHLMLDNVREAPAEMAPTKLDALDDELRRVEGYIEQALFYARSEAVDRDYLVRRHRLADLVATVLKANAPALIAAHIAPRLSGLELEVFTDEKWIEFILGQVVQNSVKYAREEGAAIEFEGRVRDEGLSSEAVELTVRDNGCGVSEADLPRVFDKGFTGSNGRTGKQSTGIGLYLVKRLCDKMDVGVTATSAPEEGFALTFRFTTNKFHYFG